jgi:hypothetical protein
MPPDMVRNGGFGDETPPEGIPVAMGVLRNGPIDSDDDDDETPAKRPPKPPLRKPEDLLTDNGEPRDSDAEDLVSPVSPVSPVSQASQVSQDEGESEGEQLNLPRGRTISGGRDDLIGFDLPEIPLKSSKRNSGSVHPRHKPVLPAVDSRSPAPSGRLSHDSGSTRGHGKDLSVVSALPFERTTSQRRLSSKSSSMDFPGELSDTDSRRGREEERPASYGTVHQHGINRVDPPQLPPLDLLGSSAELVDEFTYLTHT